MAFSFGNRSIECLKECHPHLKVIAKEAIRRSDRDWGIYHAHRTVDTQVENVAKGVSKTYLSKHLNDPSLAFDFICYTPEFKGREFEDVQSFLYVGGLLKQVASEMGFPCRYGGTDFGSFKDYPHFELHGEQYPMDEKIIEELKERGLI